MKIAARATAAQPFYAMSIGERAGILQAEGHSIAKLSLGEPDFGAPPAVREEMCRIMDGRALPYSPALGLLALREAIAGFYRDRHGVEVDPARIVVTTGASSALLHGCGGTPRRAGSSGPPPARPADTRWTGPQPRRHGLLRRAR